jgi:hypothetical protein
MTLQCSSLDKRWHEKGQIETLQEHQNDASYNAIP